MIKFLLMLITVVHAQPQPSFQEQFCPTQLNKNELLHQQAHLAVTVYKATSLAYDDANSLWDKEYLKNNPEIESALKEFKNKLRGAALLKIKPENKTAAELHSDLIQAGFTWKEVPLTSGKRGFWLINGETTKNPDDKNVVKMQIYIHKDGSMVRIKSRGIPDKSGHYRQRTPQVILCVMTNLDPNKCTDGSKCDYDTSYENEAFKVTVDGYAVPKSPSPKHGFKAPANITSPNHRDAASILMAFVHIPLKTECVK